MCHHTHDIVDIHQHNVHERVEELAALVFSRIKSNAELGATLQVCTRNIGTVMRPHSTMEFRSNIDSHAVCAAWPTPQDGNAAVASPAIYGLLCTIFEWFRVAIDGQWSLGPYDMRRWDFMHGVAPIPYVAQRDKNQAQYMMCPRTGFRKWKVSAMLDRLRNTYRLSERTLGRLQDAVGS